MVIINSKYLAKTLDILYHGIHIGRTMKKTPKTSKPVRGRPKKKVVEVSNHAEIQQKVGIPAFTEPTDYDLQDELVRLDSYAYSRYNN